jgi:serine/threonine protein kinase/WD40 repeat protein
VTAGIRPDSMGPPVGQVRCPDCGTELGSDGATGGLCPRCLLSLALVGSRLEDAPDVDSPVESEAETAVRRAAGEILGQRYQMRERLGQGGMGEVWRAYDLKLRVDVALKSVRTEHLSSEKAHELLRQEVRAAREVVSPNVCRIFDLVVEDGRELVSMEYIDGETLTEALRSRGPLELQEAREIASQFLAGLEAIHQAELVHRDFKPENVMLTRAGRVVVMDFGLAKALGEARTGSISGTPAYMAPEQARGEVVDARADVYAAGVVLAEMLTVGGEDGIEARRALWKAVRETPPRVPEGPWASVLLQALAPLADQRPASARALAHALEKVTLRLPGVDEKRPYPGLASFTEEDAEYFFGREPEVESVWKKLKRPRLLALIGPSGTGKSSFVRAGLLATLPSTWSALVATPGHRPQQALGQTLAPSLAGDPEALQSLLRFEEPDAAVELMTRWRRRHEHALVVVDQFEELFTLNPPETQAAFAELLARLVLEADVHVLLSLRDDFLVQCQRHDALAPILNELTILGPLGSSALRRALVQPALACGYRFEEEALVEEMVSEVGSERGALPLLAFAASRLWEKRDHDRGLLTREAYEEIGGVGGALSQHAEETLSRIGAHRTGLVREIFRNLVTAQGTRRSREREELLSVFAEPVAGAPASGGGPTWARNEAAEVLDALVDARLLTSYDRPGEPPGESQQEVEIVHESLLKAWPRLVRWQAQDEEGAVLRDQLGQAARTWDERGRPDDLLWTGSAYRDFVSWRERYSGSLTANEDAYAQAMSRLAGRRRRRQRAVTAAIVAATAAVAVVTSVLWQRSELSRERAEAAAVRAEASKVLALGRLELDEDPTAAAAYALKALELADTFEARRFALEAVSRGPLRIVVTEEGTDNAVFSPDGRWLIRQATRSSGRDRLELIPVDGSPSTELPRHAAGARIVVSPDSAGLLSRPPGPREQSTVVELRSFPGGEVVRRFELDAWSNAQFSDEGRAVLWTTVLDDKKGVAIRRRPIRGGSPETLARLPWDGVMNVDDSGRWLFYKRGSDYYFGPLTGAEGGVPPLSRHHDQELQGAALCSGDAVMILADSAQRVFLVKGDDRPLRLPAPEDVVPRTGRLSADCSWGANGGSDNVFRIWDLTGPLSTEPLALRPREPNQVGSVAFDPGSRWVVTGAKNAGTAIWPLRRRHPRLIRATAYGQVVALAFTPDGRWLLTGDMTGHLVRRPLVPEPEPEPAVIFRSGPDDGAIPAVKVDPSGRVVLAALQSGTVVIVPLDGSPVRRLEGLDNPAAAVAFSRDGRRVAAAGGQGDGRKVRVWDLESGEVQVLDPGDGPLIWQLEMTSRDELLIADPDGVRLWNLQDETSRLLEEPGECVMAVGGDDRYVVTWCEDRRTGRRHDVVSGGAEALDLSALPERIWTMALTDDGRTLISAGWDGIVRVGPIGGGSHHLLLGHEGVVRGLALSPDGQTIATSATEGIRLWPMPQGTPFQALPYEELLARLRNLTNVRAVVDEASPTGYALGHDPFPGFEQAPSW